MGGFFGITSKKKAVLDVYFGVDYHSHLGNSRAGMAAVNSDDGFQREIHNVENSHLKLNLIISNQGLKVMLVSVV